MVLNTLTRWPVISALFVSLLAPHLRATATVMHPQKDSSSWSQLLERSRRNSDPVDIRLKGETVVKGVVATIADSGCIVLQRNGSKRGVLYSDIADVTMSQRAPQTHSLRRGLKKFAIIAAIGAAGLVVAGLLLRKS